MRISRHSTGQCNASVTSTLLHGARERTIKLVIQSFIITNANLLERERTEITVNLNKKKGVWYNNKTKP